MTDTQPNVALLSRFDPANVAGTADVLSEDFVWHFFNPRLTDIQGDHVGRDGLQDFFQKMHERTDGTFKVNPVSITAVGDELVVVSSSGSSKAGSEGTLSRRRRCHRRVVQRDPRWPRGFSNGCASAFDANGIRHSHKVVEEPGNPPLV